MNALRIALVNSPVIAINEPWYDTPTWGRNGLAYLAGYLRQFPGYEIVIIDAKFERLNFQQTVERIKEFSPHVVGFTAFTNEIRPSAYTAALVKDSLPNVITVIGGVHATAIPKATLQEFSSFDIGVVGEGEVTFHELCESIRDGNDFSMLPGLVYRDKDAIVLNESRERVLDQDTIPFPAWDLLPPGEEYWIQTVRGCPFNCHFCMNPNGRVARKRSVANVMDEIELVLSKYKPKRLRFGDELFTVDMARSHQLMDAMYAAGVQDRCSWDCQTHVRFVDVALLTKIKNAGCYRVEMGVETGDEDKLRVMGKGTTMKQILAAGEAARAAGIPFGTFFIVGQPDETRESLKRTIQTAIKLNPDLPIIGIMCPYPGTEVARMAASGEGGYQLLTTNWDEYNKQIGGAMAFANLSRSQIEWIQITAYIKVFLYNYRFWDLAKFIWEFRHSGWKVVKKAIFNRSAFDESHLKPQDYEERLESGRKVTVDDMIAARNSWMGVQKMEMLRARRESPELLKVITVK